mmetsp:Transcript_28528/g.80490  ORF Transcript_28528/g.80490 Transcript_28528/m.80490 type:complete len:527 (-) Transcript_28528:335-1915(-)
MTNDPSADIATVCADVTAEAAADADSIPAQPSIQDMTRAQRLASLERKAFSVQELANRFEHGLTAEAESGSVSAEQIQGRQMLLQLMDQAKDLQGRVAGRNADSCREMAEGLQAVIGQWDNLEATFHRSVTEAKKAVWEFRQLVDSFKKAEGREIEEELAFRHDKMNHKGLEQQVSSLAEKVASLLQVNTMLEQNNIALQRELDDTAHQRESQSTASSQEAIQLAEKLTKEEGRGAALEQQLAAVTSKCTSLEKEVAALTAKLEEPANTPPVVQLQPVAPPPPAQAAPPPQEPAELLSSVKESSVPEYQVLGRPMLGGTLRVADTLGDPPAGNLQWSRILPDGTARLIAGACRTQYSPDPTDVGCTLRCTIKKNNKKITTDTKVPVLPSPGLLEAVRSHLAHGNGVFNVVIVQLNGEVQSRKGMFQLRVHTAGVEILSASGKVKFQGQYASFMQVCGARGGGDAASHGVYLCLQENLALMLACENAQDRNTCIMLVRQFALRHGVALGGPKDNLSPEDVRSQMAGA